MRSRLTVLLGVVTILAIVATPPLAAKPPVKNDPAQNAVQGRETLSTVGSAFCSEWTSLYDVPAGERLVVEWVSAQSQILGGTADPVDVEVRSWDGSDYVVHSLVRLDDSLVKAGSFFGTQRWSGTVRIYTEGGGSFEARMCPDAELEDETVGNVTFSGYVLEVP